MKRIALFFVLLVTLTVAAAGQPLPNGAFAGMKVRAIGPAIMGGRIADLAVVEKNPSMFYVGTASGGLLKTVNGGNTWEFLFDSESTVSIGDVTVDPTDANVVWIGTGEANNRQSSSWGEGVFKSTDGGKTWKNVGLKETHHVARIVIDPANTDIVYVAALGHLWGPNRDRGVFKTTDGGVTWQNVLLINEDTGVTDLVIDPANPKVLIAATYQRRRSGFGFNGGGPHSGIHKTVDGGRTWRRILTGLPKGDTGRIGLDIYRRNPDVVYATVENRDGGIFRSDDKGESWTRVNTLNPRPMYFSQVRVDPNDDKQIWVGGVQLNYSADSGRTFNTNAAPGVHSDHHAIWVNPANSDHVILGNDGGVWSTFDRGKTWDHINNVSIGQFYNVSVDMQKPYNIYGGMQDNYTWGGPSATRNRIGIVNDDWFQLNGGDGMYAQVDPTDHNIVYTNSQNGRIIRFDLKTGERKAVMPQQKEGDPELRWNWTTPIVISPHDPKTIYTGSQFLYRSPDRGHSWTQISPDLSLNIDRETLTLMDVAGKDIRVAKHDGMASWGNLTTISESPKRAGLLYVGTDDGQVQVSRDAGRTWTNVTSKIPNVPRQLYVSRVLASAYEEGLVFATFDGHRSDNFAPFVFASSDYGNTWRNITNNLPGGSVYVTKEDPRNAALLYVGSEFGLFVSRDRGANWTRWRNLPTVAVYDLVIHPRDNDLVLATHGRSFLVVDDITPLQQFTETVANANSHLFNSRPATMFIPHDDKGFLGGRDQRAPNPDFGAYINYYLKAPSTEDVRVTILDAARRVIRELRGAKEAGIQRVVWDLRTAGPVPVPGETPGGGGGGGFGGGGNQGVPVLPGDYTVRLNAGGQELTSTVKVEADPLVTITDADRRKLFDTLWTLNNLQTSANAAMAALNRLTEAMNQIDTLLKSNASAPAALKTAFENARRDLQDARRKLTGQASAPGEGEGGGGGGFGNAGLRNRLGQLKGEIANSQTAPTSNQLERLEVYFRDLGAVTTQINTLLTSTMTSINKQLNDGGLRPALGDALKPPTRNP